MKPDLKAVIYGFFQSIIFHSLELFVIYTIARYHIENYFVFSLICAVISALVFLLWVNKNNNKKLFRFILISSMSFLVSAILLFLLIRVLKISWIVSSELNSGDSFLIVFTLIEFIVSSFIAKGIIALVLFLKNISKIH